MEWVLAPIIGYLLGSIPVAALVARRHGVDLLRVGDRNPGAWNALEQLGWHRAWPAFIGDGAKGLLAGLAGLLLGDIYTAYAGVAGAMVGHCFPVFNRFRGGKAVMTFGGGVFALSPLAAGVALATLGAIAALRSPKWGVRIGVFGFPVVQLLFDPVERVAATGALMTLIGLRYLVPGRADRSAPATSATGAAPPA